MSNRFIVRTKCFQNIKMQFLINFLISVIFFCSCIYKKKENLYDNEWAVINNLSKQLNDRKKKYQIETKISFAIENGHISTIEINCQTCTLDSIFEVNKLKYLKFLTIDGVEVLLPKKLDSLQDLIELRVMHNPFIAAKDTLFINKTYKMDKLSIVSTRLKHITFQKGAKIRILHLYDNQISNIDSTINYLEDLEEIVLFKNYVKDVKLDTNKLQNLKFVDFIDNPILDTNTIKERYPNIIFKFGNFKNN